MRNVFQQKNVTVSMFHIVFAGLLWFGFPSGVWAQHWDHQWVRGVGGPTGEGGSVSHVAVTNQGVLFTYGWGGGDVIFNVQEEDEYEYPGNGGFLAKYDVEGMLVWVKPIPGSLYGMDTDVQGNCVVLIQISESVQLQAASGGTLDFNVEEASLLVGKLDGNGNWIWAKLEPGCQAYSGTGKVIVNEATGKILAAFASSEAVVFGKDSIHETAAPKSVHMAVYDASGAFLWVRSFSVSSAFESNQSLDFCMDGDGRYSTVMSFSDTLQYADGLSSQQWIAEQNGNGLLAQFTPEGEMAWSQQIGQGGILRHLVIGADADGHVFLSGTYSGPVTLSDYFSLEDKRRSDREYDMFWAKYQSDGALVHADQIMYAYFWPSELIVKSNGDMVISAHQDFYAASMPTQSVQTGLGKESMTHYIAALIQVDADGDVLDYEQQFGNISRFITDIDLNQEDQCFYVGKVLCRYGYSVFFGPFLLNKYFDAARFEVDPSYPYSATEASYLACVDFGAEKSICWISGRIWDAETHQVVPTVEIEFTSGEGRVLSDVNGYFVKPVVQGWSGEVIPKLSGKQFEPARRSYAEINGDVIGCDFNAVEPDSYTLSGVLFFYPSYVKIEGATLATTDGVASVVTDSDGYYELVVPRGWTGQVEITCPGLDFSGDGRTYSNVFEDYSLQDYWKCQAPVVTLSGVAFYYPSYSIITGATVRFSNGGGETATVDYGYYEKTVPWGWSGTASLEKGGLVFGPVSRDYTQLKKSMVAQDYWVVADPFTPVVVRVVSGTGQGEDHVTLDFGLEGGTVETDSTGLLTVDLPTHWQGYIEPVKQGFRFYPEGLDLTVFGNADTLSFIAYPAEASQALLCGVGLDGLTAKGVASVPFYPVFSDTLPLDLAGFDLVALGGSAQVDVDDAATLSAYAEAGGGVLLLEDAPSLLAGSEDLSSIASWLGATGLVQITDATAHAAVPGPLETGLALETVLTQADSGWAATGLDESAIPIGAWSGEAGQYHSFLKIHGVGKAAYWSTARPDTGAALTLFAAVLQWLVDENTAVESDDAAFNRPAVFELLPAYPNPFNPSTTLTYRLAEAAPVRLVIYDLSGRKVMTFDEGLKPAGTHPVVWNACDETGASVASGLYIVRITAGKQTKPQKLVLLK